MKTALISGLEKCAPLLCAARFLKEVQRDHAATLSPLLGRSASGSVLGEMDFAITDMF